MEIQEELTEVEVDIAVLRENLAELLARREKLLDEKDQLLLCI